ncbi:hypothetical protein ACFX1X_002869 [Malus domestica]
METRRGNHGLENHKAEKDDEIQELQRQVEQLTLQLERQNAHSECEGSSQGYSSDESDQNLFGRRERGRAKRFTRGFDTIKIDLLEFHGQLIPEEFLEWLRAIEKFFYYNNIPEH